MQIVVLQDQDGGFVFVRSAVVRRGEDCDNVREAVLAAPLVHKKAVRLHLVPSENAEQLVPLQQRFDWLFAEVVRALTIWIVLEVVFDSFIVVHRVGPQKVTERALKRNFDEPVDLIDLVDFRNVSGDTPMHAQVLAGNKGCQWHRIEHLHEKLVNLLIVPIEHF